MVRQIISILIEEFFNWQDIGDRHPQMPVVCENAYTSTSQMPVACENARSIISVPFPKSLLYKMIIADEGMNI